VEPGTLENLFAGGTGDLASLLSGPSARSVNGLQAFADGDMAVSGDLASDFGCTGERVAGDFVDKAVLAGFGSGEDTAGQGEFKGAALPHGGGAGPEYEEGPKSDADLRQAESGVGGGDNYVAVGNQAGSTCQGGAVDSGNDRRGEPGAGGEEALVEGVDIGCIGGGRGLGKVHAGAETLSGG